MISLTVNGKQYDVDVSPDTPLLCSRKNRNQPMRISMPPCRATSADAAPINVSGARSIARPACRGWHMEKTLTRRTFLKVSAAGGALVVSGYLPGLRESSTAE